MDIDDSDVEAVDDIDEIDCAFYEDNGVEEVPDGTVGTERDVKANHTSKCEEAPRINASVADALLDMQPSTSYYQDDAIKSGCLDALPAAWRDRLDLAASMINCLVSPRARRRPVPAQGSTGTDGQTDQSCEETSASNRRRAYVKRSAPVRFMQKCLSTTVMASPPNNNSTEHVPTPTASLHLSRMPFFSDQMSLDGVSSSSESNSSRLRLSFYRASRFSNVAPTIQFAFPPEKISKPDRRTRRLLCWCHNALLPKLIRKLLANSHFTICDESLYWLGYWGRHMSSKRYRTVFPYQRVNHYAGTYHLGRKDRLWQHLSRASRRFPGFDIMPRTFVLPEDAEQLRMYMRGGSRIILKPPALARGSGIKIVSQYNKVPRCQELVAQEYIERPLLINNTKFDLRLYVMVTSFDPLRAYLYEDGLVRFASQTTQQQALQPYSEAVSSLQNQYIHLTNYSINKNGEKAPDKWSLRCLWAYLQRTYESVDLSKLMQSIVDCIIRALIAAESSIVTHLRAHVRHPSLVCYELLGVDILLDETFKPWLLEVNISPSLQVATDTDKCVKLPLARDTLNLAGIQVPPVPVSAVLSSAQPTEQSDPRLWVPKFPPPPPSPLVADYRSKPLEHFLTDGERAKCAYYIAQFEREESYDSILSNLTSADVRVLIETEDEYDRRGSFTRIMPSPFGSQYLNYMLPRPHYNDLLLDAWTRRYFHNRIEGCALLESVCVRNGHLVMPPVNNCPL